MIQTDHSRLHTLKPPSTPPAREIGHRTRGYTHGGITRLMSPSDLGQVLKPFVFLDIFTASTGSGMGVFPMHPHSGIATLTYMITGEAQYEDSTGEHGKRGLLPAGGVEWMMAGGGVWHSASPSGREPMLGFQLWLAMPPALENAPSQSLYLSPDQLPRVGPVRVLLGEYGTAASAIPAPAPINYLAVHLKAGEHWRYEMPAQHELAWIAVAQGEVSAGAAFKAGDMAVFAESAQTIEFQALADTIFVLGSAAKHAHPLHLGSYSVHTSAEALRSGEAGIRRVAGELRAQGRL